MRTKILAAVGCLVAALVVGIVWAQSTPPPVISYQGRLNDAAGQPLDGVTVDLTLAFYGAPTGGTLYLTALEPGVPVVGGIYNVLIGSGTVTPGTESSLAAVFQNHAEVWMGVKVGADPEVTPRSRISSAAYSMSVDLGAIYTNAEADPDHDGDGHRNPFIGGDDCNDNDSSIFAGAVEICDGVDNQCPGDPGYGQVDEGC